MFSIKVFVSSGPLQIIFLLLSINSSWLMLSLDILPMNPHTISSINNLKLFKEEIILTKMTLHDIK